MFPHTPLPPICDFHAYQRCLAPEAARCFLALSSHLLCALAFLAIGCTWPPLVMAKDTFNLKLMELARFYLSHFTITGPLTVKQTSGPTPVLSEHPSCPSFEEARYYAFATTQQTGLDHYMVPAAVCTHANSAGYS
ncbi:hypothetical protein EDC04DRAFT_2673697 [Pisolithus marmoratus]|nr:hypothetical protein EDC04DRAFT_2673697 [Pisolithus marmoratus]